MSSQNTSGEYEQEPRLRPEPPDKEAGEEPMPRHHRGRKRPQDQEEKTPVKVTSFSDIQDFFHTMPQTRYEIPEALEAEWLKIAVADFELNIGCDLHYDPVVREFDDRLSSVVCRTLAQLMYVYYLQRELSRVMALNGIYGKDVQLTGQDATKRVTKQELDDQKALVETLLHRQKDPAYN